jgi:hypothetical protein
MQIATILTRKYPETLWSCVDNDYTQLDWQDETPKPSKKELEALWPSVLVELETEQAQRMRATAYRETTDPLFFKYQRGEATEQEWLAAVQAVKDAHPYPDEA